ncbi:MAG: GGDEF domain-containing protein [Planctomycetota bacterium]|nr:MAG: GGDEF domain-containing protein [Planctomycetota bacterium]
MPGESSSGWRRASSVPDSQRVLLGSGPLAALIAPRRASLVVWRPLLAVLGGICCTLAAAGLGRTLDWSAQEQTLCALLASACLIAPATWLEYRPRCLIGLLPALSLLEPMSGLWGMSLLWLVSLGAAWWLRHRELQVVPAGLKQRQLAKQLERYPLLHHACLELATSRDADDVARIVAKQAMRLGIGALGAGVWLDRPPAGLDLRAVEGLGPIHGGDSEENRRFASTEGRPLIRRYGAQLRCWLSLSDRPSSSQAGGVLEVSSAQDASVDDYNIELLSALARMGGIAMGTVKLIDQTRALALRDDLTDLLGQQEFRRRAGELIAHAMRQDHRSCLILCDLDHLKAYNDTWGHLSGDQALQAVARTLRNACPPGGLLGRWGGEEFVMLITGSDLKAAENLAEHVREGISGTVLDGADAARRVTASLGLAEHITGEPFDTLLARADAACYRAKETGRNRVIVAATPEPAPEERAP